MILGVFDAVATGHHPSWIEPVTRALLPLGDVTLFLSKSLAARVPHTSADVELVADNAVDASHQLDVLAEIASSGRIDHLLHLYAIKPVIREWLRRPRLAVPCSIVVTHPSSLHYQSVYGTRLSGPERLNAWYKELLVRRWRRRADAHSLFTMEEPAVARWSRQNGAPAYFWPEPPIPSDVQTPGLVRQGCLVCGAIRASKNLETVARALEGGSSGIHLVLAGEVHPSYQPTLRALTEQMVDAGLTVDLQMRWHSPAEIMEALARAQCLLIPSLNHKGTSHTLVEAAAAGTPVVVHNGGMLGHMVKRYGLGLAVDCTDPRALRGAILKLVAHDQAATTFAPGLAEFASCHSPERFRSALWAPFLQVPERHAEEDG